MFSRDKERCDDARPGEGDGNASALFFPELEFGQLEKFGGCLVDAPEGLSGGQDHDGG